MVRSVRSNAREVAEARARALEESNKKLEESNNC